MEERREGQNKGKREGGKRWGSQVLGTPQGSSEKQTDLSKDITHAHGDGTHGFTLKIPHSNLI